MIRKLYRANQRYAFNLSYSARERRIGKELLVVDTSLKVPSDWQSRVPDHYFLATA